MRLLTIGLICLVYASAPYAMSKTIYGYIEHATLTEQNISLPAKLDTGAKSSSLHAIDIEKVLIDGKAYVKFAVPYAGKKVHFTCEYFGKVHIKARSQEIEHMVRPVVWMKVKLGNQEQMIRVNLTNRANFMYPLLLGRQAIVSFHGIIDPSLKYSIVESEQKAGQK